MTVLDLAARPRTTPDAATAEWRRRLMLIVLPALLMFAFAIASRAMFTDGDTNWQVAAGRWILAHGAVPKVDPFSYTMGGKPWVAHEWGAEVLLASAYGLGGWAGVMVLVGAAAALAIAIIGAEITPRIGTATAVVTLALAFAVLLPMLLARPHVLAWPPLAFWIVRLLQARRQNRAPPAWMVGLMLVWANLHGSYVFGLAFTGAFALEAVLGAPGRRLATALRWGGFLAAATLAAAITPNGLEGLIFPVRVMLMTSLKDIGEWTPAKFDQLTPFEVALMVALFALIYRGVRVGAVRLGLLLVLLHMALQHVRQEAIMAIAGPLLLAEPLGRALAPQRNLAPNASSSPGRLPMAEVAPPLGVAALLFLGLAVWRLAQPLEQEDHGTTPVTALAHVPPALAAQPVLNDYGFGGWLIFKGVRPFIDGRADMYGDAFVQNYLKVDRDADPSAIQATFARWRIAWTILGPKSKLVEYLDHTPGWRRLYADKWAVVQVRDDAWPQQAPASLRQTAPGPAAGPESANRPAS